MKGSKKTKIDAQTVKQKKIWMKIKKQNQVKNGRKKQKRDSP